jgi:hypothetical protein
MGLLSNLGLASQQYAQDEYDSLQHMQLHEAYKQAQQAQLARNAYQLSTNAAMQSQLSNAYTYSATSLPETKLDEGAWDVPISQLVDLWIFKFGSKWVWESELDDFYIIAAKRLKALSKIEQHYVNGANVFRIVE